MVPKFASKTTRRPFLAKIHDFQKNYATINSQIELISGWDQFLYLSEIQLCSCQTLIYYHQEARFFAVKMQIFRALGVLAFNFLV